MHLQFSTATGETEADVEVEDLRITGGVIWDHLEQGVLASYADGCWKHRGALYPLLWITGPCQVHFGITRDPLPVSEPISVFSIIGATLRANGVGFAQYSQEHDMWQGLIRPTWWQSMRIVGASPASIFMHDSDITLSNPWDAIAQDLNA